LSLIIFFYHILSDEASAEPIIDPEVKNNILALCNFKIGQNMSVEEIEEFNTLVCFQFFI
jgi:hypothetical protein